MATFTIWHFLVLLVLVIQPLLFIPILRKAGLSAWWVLLAPIPIVNLLVVWLFAFCNWPAIDRGVDSATPESLGSNAPAERSSSGRLILPIGLVAIVTVTLVTLLGGGREAFSDEYGVFRDETAYDTCRSQAAARAGTREGLQILLNGCAEEATPRKCRGLSSNISRPVKQSDPASGTITFEELGARLSGKWTVETTNARGSPRDECVRECLSRGRYSRYLGECSLGP